jgi:hypothetical protein
MAIMDLVRDVTTLGAAAPVDVTGVTIRCGDCGRDGAGSAILATWGYARAGDRVWHTCPDCVRASLDEVETHIRH